jgi:hypothetical protein
MMMTDESTFEWCARRSSHHALGTLSRRHGAPGTFERGFCSFYSSVDISLAGALDLVRHERVIAGIVDSEGLVGFGVCVLQKLVRDHYLRFDSDTPRC